MRKRIGALLAALVLLAGCGAGSGIAVVEEAPEAEAEMVKYVALTFDDGRRPAARRGCWTDCRSWAPGPPSLWWAVRW